MRISLFCLLVFMCTGYGLAQDISRLDQHIEARMMATGVPALSVAVIAPDGRVIERAYGVRDVETRTKATPDTLFHIGSIVKTWTALSLLKAMEARQLSEHAPIGSFVSGLRPQLAELTVHQILSHTSGLADSSSSLGLVDDQALETIVADPKSMLSFTEPGQIMSYSNPGFRLAGYVLQQLTGKPYADAVTELLLQPVGADHTHFRPMLAMTYPVALGHTVKSGNVATVLRPMPFSAEAMPSGHVFTTAKDVARVAAMLMTGGKSANGVQVVSAAVIKKMTAAHAPMAEAAGRTSYGYGLFVEGTPERRIWFHGGGLDGYNSYMTVRPDQAVAVVVLANASAAGLVDEIKTLVVKEFTPQPPAQSLPKTATKQKMRLAAVPRKLASALEGTWGQGAYVFTVSRQARGLQFAMGKSVLGILQTDGSERLAIRSADDQIAGYVAVVRDTKGAPKYLAWGARAIVRLSPNIRD